MRKSTQRTVVFVATAGLVAAGAVRYGPRVVSWIDSLFQGGGRGSGGGSDPLAGPGGDAGCASGTCSDSTSRLFVESKQQEPSSSQSFGISPELQALNERYWKDKLNRQGLPTPSWMSVVPPPSNPRVNLIPK